MFKKFLSEVRYLMDPKGNNHHSICPRRSRPLEISLAIFLCLMLVSQMLLANFTIFGYNPTHRNAYAAYLPDFNFAAAGDWGCQSDASKTVDNIISKKTELTLGLGDYSYGRTDDCWFKIISPLDRQTKIVIGNHDYDYPGKFEGYMSHFQLEREFYSFNYQNVHFTVMSTETAYNETSEQYAFVKKDLADAALNPNIRWIVVAFHSPMYLSYQIDPEHSPLPELRNIYHPLFDQFNVDLVLQAHQHAYERTVPIKYNGTDPGSPIITNETSASSFNDPQGEIFATVGTGGQSPDVFLSRSPFSVTQFSTYGFLNIDIVNGGSTMRATFYGNDETIRDQFTIVKSPPANNSRPAAVLTADRTSIAEDEIANLVITSSYDSDGDSLTYAFRQVAGTTGTITVNAQNPARAVFEPPSVSADETDIIEVTVDDGRGGVTTAKIGIHIQDNLNNTSVCNCVVFRIDDITDYSYSTIKSTVMDQFITRGQEFSLGIVMNHFGKDQNVVDKVREGYNKGLFELTIHGWDHVKFTDYSMEQQKEMLESSNSKLKDMFGTTSYTFLPPYGVANTDTLIAMNQLGYKVLSVQKANEFVSQFVADGSKVHDGYGVYHLPYTAKFIDYGVEDGVGIKVPVEKVLSDIDAGIKKYGYTVVVMHPQDFGVQVDGRATDEVDQSQINDLDYIIDAVTAKGRSITSFYKVVGLEIPHFADTVAPSIMAPKDIVTVQTGSLTHVSLGTPSVRDGLDPSPTVTNDSPTDGFPLGTRIVTWTATDASGNVATSHQYVTIAHESDTTLPLVSITSPKGGSVIPGPFSGVVVTVSGKASDVGSGIKLVSLKTGEGPFENISPKISNDWSEWQRNVTIENEGTVYLQAKAIDYFGNTRWSSRIPITITFENSSKASSEDNIQSVVPKSIGSILDYVAAFPPLIMIIPVIGIPSIAIFVIWRQKVQKRSK